MKYEDWDGRCFNCNNLSSVVPLSCKYVTKTMIKCYCVVCGVTSCLEVEEQ